MQLIPILLNFFGVGGVIGKFFIGLGRKIAISSLLIPIQFTVVGALLIAKLAFLTSIIILVVTVFVAFDDLLLYINNLSNNSYMSLPIDILNSMGVLPALNDAFSVFSVSFISIFVLFITKFFIDSLKLASDEFYKVGMLLNAGFH